MSLISTKSATGPEAEGWHPGAYLPLLAYILGALLLIAVGYNASRQIKDLIQQEKLDNLNSVATMKVGQITSWREAQLQHVETISRVSLLPEEFDLWLHEGATSSTRKQEILHMVSGLREIYGYRGIALIGRQSAASLQIGIPSLNQEEFDLAKRAMDSRIAMLSDIHREINENNLIGIDLAVPLLVGEGARSRVVGAAIMQIDPAKFLYPLIQTWPSKSLTAETLLVRQDGQDILFLNELRHRKGTALTLRVPLATPDLPPAMFLRKQPDRFNGIDYRGVPVVAIVKPVPGTPWLMVAKIDKDELYAPLHKFEGWSLLLGLILLTGGGVLFFSWFQAYQARFQHLKAQRDVAIKQELLSKHFEHLTRFANDIIMVADENGRVVEANERAMDIYGYTHDELLKMCIKDFRIPGEDPALIERQFGELRERGALIFETINCRKDGTTFPVEVSARVIDMKGKKYLQGIIRDITERKSAERHLFRLNKFYAAISQTNAAIVRIKDKETLLQEICRIIVGNCQLKLVWIGMIDRETQHIQCIASCGPASGYLDGLQISLDPTRPEGRGPTATAICENRLSICNDFETDPRAAPWLDKARKFGLRCSASWPIMTEGQTVGALNLYADETGYFDNEMTQLLSTIARDIAYALDSLAVAERQCLAEESLRQSEEKFRTLVANIPQRIFIKDARSVYVFCNEPYARDLNINAREIEGKTDFDFYEPELAEKYRNDDQRIIAAGEIEDIQERYLQDGGQERYVQTIKVPLKDKQGKASGVLGIFWDITERWQAEEELKRQQIFLRQVIDADPNLIFVKDYDGTLLLVNQAMAAFHGTTPSGLVGHNASDLFRNKADYEPHLQADRQVIESRQAMTFVANAALGGKDSWLQVIKAPVELSDGTVGVLGIVADITDIKEAEEELRKYTAQIEDLYNNAPCGYHSLDKDGVIVRINDTELRWLGYSREEVVGKMKLLDLYAPSSRQIFERTFPVFLKEGQINELEIELLRKNGAILPVAVSATGMYDENGNFLMSRSTMFDITLRRIAEEELRLYGEIITHMEESVILVSADSGSIIYVNPKSEQMFGYQPGEMIGLPVSTLNAPTLSTPEQIAQEIISGLDANGKWEGEILNCNKNGTPFWCRAKVSIIEHHVYGKIWVSIHQDITEQKNAEAIHKEIERIDRLNIATEMASGLAHELSQPLSAANNYLTGCLFRMNEPHWDKAKLQAAVALTYKQTERAGKIIAHLKDLIRKEKGLRVMVDINELINDSINFLGHEIKSQNIRLATELLPLPQVVIHKVEIGQVLLNLLKNAIEAMRDKPQRELRVSTCLDDSGNIRVAISDTGGGILPSDLDEIFNPFKTSKSDGLGLGLAICRSLVENHGGRIWAEAQQGAGARFLFTLSVEATNE